MTELAFYVFIGLAQILGLLLLGKQFLFPSMGERKNKPLRSVISALGGTISGIGLMLLIFYNMSPSTFWGEWSFPRVIGFGACIVFPLFCALAVGMLAYYTTWERLDEFAKNRLRKITEQNKQEK